MCGNQSRGGLERCLDSVTNHSTLGQPGHTGSQNKRPHASSVRASLVSATVTPQLPNRKPIC
ncbi:hypothetical protein EYF80_058241 [Liparis tanakae]|uniref:Uncharacterized protein n=1 Tax=Liparis tanakae TaxID=230148 RepID=A0A4Z2ES22_9TELE|nr:hypothetical protein EYF80_058241 [Liparis tanakae]